MFKQLDNIVWGSYSAAENYMNGYTHRADFDGRPGYTSCLIPSVNIPLTTKPQIPEKYIHIFNLESR